MSPACRPAPVLASSAGHLNHSRLVGRAASARSELPGASEEGLGKRSRRGRGTLLVRKGPGGGSGAPLFPSHPPAPISPHRRRPRQLFNHYPTDFLAGGPPSPPPLLRVLRRDPEAQRGGLHGRYRWPRGWGGPPPSPRSQGLRLPGTCGVGAAQPHLLLLPPPYARTASLELAQAQPGFPRAWGKPNHTTPGRFVESGSTRHRGPKARIGAKLPSLCVTSLFTSALKASYLLL